MILNLAAYHFLALADVDALIAGLRERLGGCTVRGTVLVAPEGINLVLAGDPGELREFVGDLLGDPRFAGMVLKWSESQFIPFRKLIIKARRETISFRREGLDPAAERAPAVDPVTLARWLQQGADDAGRNIVLVDTRNEQEVAFGTFDQALTLPITKFTELPQALEACREALRDKTIVSFCTGGIRCEKAAIWMQQAGFGKVLQLDGGILNYFEQVGAYGYRDRCFVFDERVALDPDLKPMVDAPTDAGD